MAAVLPTDLAQAISYGPQTAQAIRRSQYLSDALKSLGETSTKIQSPGELGAKLLAFAILNKATDRAQKATIGAVKADEDAETTKLLGGLQPTPASPVAPPPLVPQTPPAPPGPVDPGIGAPKPEAPTMPPEASTLAPQDRTALAQMVWGEARGETPEGQRAAAAVALNRARMSGKPVSEIVAQPHQFAGFNDRSRATTDADLGPIYQNIDPLISGQAPDPTNGADHFYNPALAQPSWGGAGQDIGHHRFLALGFGGHAPGAPAPPAATAAPAGQASTQGAPPPAVPPYQIAATGPTPPPPASSPGVSSPPADGGPPAALPPQASAAGGNPFADWPTWKPSPQEVTWVEGLLRDPKTHAVGVQRALAMRQKMTEPVEATIQTINGVPFYVAKDPTSGAPIKAIPVPPQAMSQTLSAAQAGISAPPGTTFNRDPTGNVKQVYQPQNGQQLASGPGQPYREAPIQGGTNDPTAPAARFANEGKLRDDYAKEVQPYIQAREGYQKVIQAAKDGTPAGDIALVFGYMKTLDPGSTVREGEQATVQNSGTVDQRVANLYNSLLTGQGRLSPEQRAQFSQSARNQFEVYQRTFDAANQRYAGLAQSYGMDPRNVVRTFDPIKPYEAHAPGGGSPPVTAAARAQYDALARQGKIDATKPWGDPAHPYVAATPEILHSLDRPQFRGMHVITPDGHLAVID